MITKLTNEKVSLLIPCLNEQRTIKVAVSDAKKNGRKYFGKDFEIIVADNGSTDGTLEVLKKIKGVKLLKVAVRGYGAALHNGVLNAKGDYVIFADADLSYPFSNLKSFKKVMEMNNDLVLGSRITGSIQKKSMPFLHRYLGTPILTFLIRFLYGIKTTDCNSGMRMIKKSFYKKLNMRNSGMEWASELLCKTAIKKGKYYEVPIVFTKDKRGKKAHLSTWSDGWRHLKAILLIKPISVLYLSLLSLILSIIFYKTNFAVTYLFLICTEVLMLSYTTLRLLESIIEGSKNWIADLLFEFKIVPLLIVFTIVQFILLFIISNDHMGTKLMLVSLLGITYMWAFLVETIKTHLVNRI